MTVYWPVPSPHVTEEAGTRGGTHTGIDLRAQRGDPVLAAFDGVAVYVGGDGARGEAWPGSGIWANGEGRTIDIRRADGLISRVGHLDGYAIRQGDTVRAGQLIGFAGDSGFSTGVHVHWETRWDRAWTGGRWVNPREFDPQVYRAPSPDPVGESVKAVRRRRLKKTRENMVYIYLHNGAGKNGHLFALFQLGKPGTWMEFSGQESANQLADQHGSAMRVWPNMWNDLKKRHS